MAQNRQPRNHIPFPFRRWASIPAPRAERKRLGPGVTVRAGILDNDGGGDKFLVDLRVVRVLAHLRSTKALAAGVRPGVVAACGGSDASGMPDRTRLREKTPHGRMMPRLRKANSSRTEELRNSTTSKPSRAIGRWRTTQRKASYSCWKGALAKCLTRQRNGVSATGSRAGEEVLDIGVQARIERAHNRPPHSCSPDQDPPQPEGLDCLKESIALDHLLASKRRTVPLRPCRQD
jgi:hypothetical protein